MEGAMPAFFYFIQLYNQYRRRDVLLVDIMF